MENGNESREEGEVKTVVLRFHDENKIWRYNYTVGHHRRRFNRNQSDIHAAHICLCVCVCVCV